MNKISLYIVCVHFTDIPAVQYINKYFLYSIAYLHITDICKISTQCSKYDIKRKIVDVFTLFTEFSFLYPQKFMACTL